MDITLFIGPQELLLIGVILGLFVALKLAYNTLRDTKEDFTKGQIEKEIEEHRDE